MSGCKGKTLLVTLCFFGTYLFFESLGMGLVFLCCCMILLICGATSPLCCVLFDVSDFVLFYFVFCIFFSWGKGFFFFLVSGSSVEVPWVHFLEPKKEFLCVSYSLTACPKTVDDAKTTRNYILLLLQQTEELERDMELVVVWGKGTEKVGC